MAGLILGSSSKWRQALLKDFGVGEFSCLSPDIDEKAIRDADPAKMVVMIADGKMDELIRTMPSDTDAVVVTSDQVIVVDDAVREKPESVDECKRFLTSYSNGKPAIAHVGVVVYNTKTKQRLSGHATAEQYFKRMPESFFDELIAQGDVMTCAGGFCIERMAEYEGERKGEIECIQGLPRALTLDLLTKVGFSRAPVPAQ